MNELIDKFIETKLDWSEFPQWLEDRGYELNQKHEQTN